MSTATVRGTVRGMARTANPAFAGAVVAIPVAAFGYAVTVGTVLQHTYVHVMAGVLWTGIDLFMGMVVGPVVGGMDEESTAAFFERFTPKATFLLPTVAIVTIFGGITLAIRVGLLPSPDAWLALFTLVNLPGALLLIGWQFDAWRDWRWATPFGVSLVGSAAWVALTIESLVMPSSVVLAALVVVSVLNLQGFGLILPGEVRVYRELNAPSPDTGVVARVGQRNATLAGVQGLFQLGIVVLMVYMGTGRLPLP